jgi:predicted Zn-dependent protease
VTWQKLTTLISALQQLQSEDPRVAKCVKSLKESREPLNLALEDDESRFEKALSEGRFAQAAQLLRKADVTSQEVLFFRPMLVFLRSCSEHAKHFPS